MDINNIELTTEMIAGLYPSSIVDINEQPGQILTKKNLSQKQTEKEPSIDTGWKLLGDNKKNILIAVNYQEVMHLPDDDLTFLTEILTACKLNLGDVAIINMYNYPETDYKKLLSDLKTKVVLLFDIEPAAFGLPLSFPHFQIQPFAGCSFLYSPALHEVAAEKILKSKLWVSLRRLFNI